MRDVNMHASFPVARLTRGSSGGDLSRQIIVICHGPRSVIAMAQRKSVYAPVAEPAFPLLPKFRSFQEFGVYQGYNFFFEN